MSQGSPQLANAERPVRVLIVDDSAFMRFALAKRLNETEGLQVVGAAHDGTEALSLIPKLNPDVVTLDVEMPHMDGLSTLREIMTKFPRPVVMLSSLTTDGARETVQALMWGAVDFITKPVSKANLESIIDEVVLKIQKAARARVYTMPAGRLAVRQTVGAGLTPTPSPKQPRPLRANEKVVVIGASTGGPRALQTVIEGLPPDLPAAVLIVQHMPVGFTRSLAERLDSVSGLAIKEAVPGDSVEVGRGLVAPGGFHMTIDANGQVAVNQNPPVHGVRPAVDVTMTSVAQRYKAATVGVVLTGMGCDGTHGATLIHASGGHIIAEDESTSVVWGMPRSVAEAGVADEVLPLQVISAAIEKAVRTT